MKTVQLCIGLVLTLFLDFLIVSSQCQCGYCYSTCHTPLLHSRTSPTSAVVLPHHLPPQCSGWLEVHGRALCKTCRRTNRHNFSQDATPPSLSFSNTNIYCRQTYSNQIKSNPIYLSRTHGQQMLMRVQRNACASSSDNAVITNE